ncbi:MAG TPA: DNA polymerase III subunit delta' [Acidobacteriota bacterium]|nr:DNA polymerase III subunit delta' [Acidobacteriota bacterium]
MRLSALVGNQQLIGLLRRNPLPPAAIFAGPEGVGKRSAALGLAALANCRQPVSNDLCGSCVSCIKAEAGTHPDIVLYVPDNNHIKIEAMRELSHEAHYRPFEGQSRVFVIDQAEKMTEEAANSLLKTLEEPPPTSHLLLITAFPQRLLPTIRSRCQSFRFRSLSRKEINDYLQSTGGMADSELRAAFARGSIGRALSLDIEDLVKSRDIMLDLLTAWHDSKSFEAIFKRADASPLKTDLKDRNRTRNYLELLHSLAEDVYFLVVGTPDRLISIDRRQALEKLSRQLTLDQIRNLLYHIEQSYRDVEQYVSPLMSFETLWLRAEQGMQDG